jgi:DHA1 family tetracycline resistance protein-like MFS transporter
MYRCGWDERMVGFSLGVVGVLVAVVQGLLIRVVNPWLGNVKSIYMGLSLYLIGMLLFGFAYQGWMMFVFLVPYCLGGFAQPALQSAMAGFVPPNEQGALQGSLASLMSASAIVGPLMMNNLFYYFTHSNAPIQLPGAPFFAGAFLFMISLVMAYKSLGSTKK